MIFILAGAAAVLSTSRSVPDPVFGGRTLTDWLMAADYDRNRDQVSQAVLSSGPEGVAVVRALLRSGNKLQRIIVRRGPVWLWNRWPLKHWRKQFLRKERAMAALEILGEAGHEAIPDLLAIIQDPTEVSETRQRAMQILFVVRADGALVIPILNKLSDDPVIGRSASRCVKDFKTGKFLADRPITNRAAATFQELNAKLVPDENFKLVEKNNRGTESADLRRKAEGGDAEAQAHLATLLHQGREGFSKSDAEACKWATVAASHGDRTAKYLLRELELFMDAKDVADAKAAADAFVSDAQHKAE